jgi:hypothetical protein
LLIVPIQINDKNGQKILNSVLKLFKIASLCNFSHNMLQRGCLRRLGPFFLIMLSIHFLAIPGVHDHNLLFILSNLIFSGLSKVSALLIILFLQQETFLIGFPGLLNGVLALLQHVFLFFLLCIFFIELIYFTKTQNKLRLIKLYTSWSRPIMYCCVFLNSSSSRTALLSKLSLNNSSFLILDIIECMMLFCSEYSFSNFANSVRCLVSFWPVAFV